jgi:hypothetical protein
VSSISILNFEVLAKRFKNKEFGIEELQSRLNTAIMPEKPILDLSKRLQDLENKLELILYTQLESQHFQLAVSALEDFIAFLRKHD